MKIRFYLDPTTGLPHIYNHDVDEDEVEQVLGNPDEDRPGTKNSRVAIGRTEAGRILRVIYVRDPRPDSVFVSIRIERQPVSRIQTTHEKETEMKRNRFPRGWNEARVRAVLEHYESQTEEEAVAEDEAAFRRRDQAVMVVPKRLVSTITKLITRAETVAARRRHHTTLQPPSRAQRKSKLEKNPRAARG